MKFYTSTKGKRLHQVGCHWHPTGCFDLWAYVSAIHIIHQSTVPTKKALRASNQHHGKFMSSSKAYQTDEERTSRAYDITHRSAKMACACILAALVLLDFSNQWTCRRVWLTLPFLVQLSPLPFESCKRKTNTNYNSDAGNSIGDCYLNCRREIPNIEFLMRLDKGEKGTSVMLDTSRYFANF